MAANDSTDNLIHIENLTKVFYTDEIETHALSGVHLSIRRGEYVAMSGPSGCGKSTLLSILGLLDTPTGGDYTLNSKAVANLNFADRSRIRNQEIGFIFQSFNLIGDLTVYENVELPLTYRSGMPASERKDRVQRSLQPGLLLTDTGRGQLVEEKELLVRDSIAQPSGCRAAGAGVASEPRPIGTSASPRRSTLHRGRIESDVG